MKTTGQLEGRHAIREGYTHDSMGLAIDPNGIYNSQGEEGKWTYLCRVGVTPKKGIQPLVRK